mmetsp:Transcript_16954/g.48231  ORF Transcript_16954/g.48231 Transcript_16954/m.48231 type:complete len:280 (+) Transcript_16954:946-1785(+)
MLKYKVRLAQLFVFSPHASDLLNDHGLLACPPQRGDLRGEQFVLPPQVVDLHVQLLGVLEMIRPSALGPLRRSPRGGLRLLRLAPLPHRVAVGAELDHLLDGGLHRAGLCLELQALMHHLLARRSHPVRLGQQHISLREEPVALLGEEEAALVLEQFVLHLLDLLRELLVPQGERAYAPLQVEGLPGLVIVGQRSDPVALERTPSRVCRSRCRPASGVCGRTPPHRRLLGAGVGAGSPAGRLQPLRRDPHGCRDDAAGAQAAEAAAAVGPLNDLPPLKK